MNTTIEIPKCASSEILSLISSHSLRNGLVGNVSNLCADHFNDYKIDSYISDYIYDNKEYLDVEDIERIQDEPDSIIQDAAYLFFDALTQLWKTWSIENPESSARNTMLNANMYFESSGNYYLYDNVVNSKSVQYLIRADSEQEAFMILITEYENAFEINDDHPDNLIFVGCIKLEH